MNQKLKTNVRNNRQLVHQYMCRFADEQWKAMHEYAAKMEIDLAKIIRQGVNLLLNQKNK